MWGTEVTFSNYENEVERIFNELIVYIRKTQISIFLNTVNTGNVTIKVNQMIFEKLELVQ